MKAFPKVKAIEERQRVAEIVGTFKDEHGHTCESVGRNTMSKIGKRVATKKKNHARNGDYLGRAVSKTPYQTLPEAKGHAGIIPVEKKYLYGKVIPQSRESVLGEIADVVAKEKKLGMIIGIMMRAKRAGTYECIHDIEHKWTSLRMAEDKKTLDCQCCGMKLIITG
jgi:hypothetical protein